MPKPTPTEPLQELIQPIALPGRYPNEKGAGQRLQQHLQVFLPAVINSMMTGDVPPLLRAALASVPQLLSRATFSDMDAITLLESVDGAVGVAFEQVLGVVPAEQPE